MGFWHLGQRGPVRTERSLRVQEWAAIRRNYAGLSAAALDDLMSMARDALPGKLLLLHGPPGTGKTTACARWPTPGAPGASSTTCSTPSGSSTAPTTC